METHNRRAVLKTAGSVAVIGSLAGCAGGEGQETNETNESGMDDGNETNTTDEGMDDGTEMANVRVAHLAPDAPNVDVYVDDEAVLEDVSFGTISDYLELEPGSYDVRITETGTEEAVYDESLEVEAANYTVAAIGEISEENQPFAVEVFEDDLSDPGEMGRIRGIHAAPDAPAVDVVGADSGDALFEDLAFGESQTAEAPAGEYTFEILPAGDDEADPVATFDATVEAGTVYSAFVIGYLEPDDAPADEELSVELVEDSAGMDSMGGGGNTTEEGNMSGENESS
jgi:hypothetical protein